jgi:hypothetical protein
VTSPEVVATLQMLQSDADARVRHEASQALATHPTAGAPAPAARPARRTLFGSSR